MAEYICPHCKNPITDDEALLCLYCGESLNRSVGVMGSLNNPVVKVVIVSLILVLVLAFVLLLAR
ncbi:MAG: zinc ribbon domain-containing protein [Candidatus Omnitrophota bacterium]|jgi:hypothetical protein